jgi:hypothetical protein
MLRSVPFSTFWSASSLTNTTQSDNLAFSLVAIPNINSKAEMPAISRADNRALGALTQVPPLRP